MRRQRCIGTGQLGHHKSCCVAHAWVGATASAVARSGMGAVENSQRAASHRTARLVCVWHGCVRILPLLVLLSPCMCGGDLPAAGTLSAGHVPRARDQMGTPMQERRSVKSAEAGHGPDLHSSMAYGSEKYGSETMPPCAHCTSMACIGLALPMDGAWVKFLCEHCHGSGNSSDSGQGKDKPLEALVLAGKCTKCRTKASYGRAYAPPLRCGRHKLARDIPRSLGPSCVVEGCAKARLFGSRGGQPLFCATHRRQDDIDVKNKHCQFDGCSRQASYGDADTRIKTACAQHRLHWHVDLKHESKRCAAPEGCGKLGVFKRRLVPPSLGAPPHNTEPPPKPPNHITETPTELAAPTAQAVDEQGRRAQTEDDIGDQDWRTAGKLRCASPQDLKETCSLLKATNKRVVFVCAAHSNLNVFTPVTKDEVCCTVLCHTPCSPVRPWTWRPPPFHFFVEWMLIS